MKTPVKIISLTLLLFALMSSAWAQIPRTISYQGVLADAAGNPKADGDYAFTFRLYETSNGGIAIWSETKTLTIKRGLFSTALGDQTTFGTAVKFDKPYWLSIQVGNEAELPDRIALSASAYSLNSLKADVAASVAEGQVVKSINALKDDVLLEGAGGATVTAAGGKITISAAGGSGTGIQGVQNTDNTLDIANPNGPTATVNLKSPLILPGNVGIGTATPNHRLGISGGPLWTSYSWNGSLEFDNAAAIGWRANAAGQRFGMGHTNTGFYFFRTASDPGTTASPADYDMVINDAGNVGIGTFEPTSKLEIAAQDALKITGYQPLLTFQDANAGNARGRIQSVSGGLNFFTESYMSGVNGFAFLTLNNSGNVGIGSSQPVSKLEIVGQDALAMIGYQPVLTFRDISAGYARGVIQSVSGGLNFFTESYMSGANPFAYFRLDNSGNVGIGTATPQTKLDINGTTSTKVLTITGGSDLAEPFETADELTLEPGTVMVIDVEHPGKLVVSASAYDRKVAGVVSGAGGIKAGITLYQEGMMEGNALVAIAGRVYCQAEADTAPIQPGDLLTTSSIPGHAMKATEDSRSHGAIIGKAMSSLKEGRGLVLVLVNLQ